MNTYLDLIVACGVSAKTPQAEIDARAQQVMQNPLLSLRAKGLFVLLAEMQGEPHNPFTDLLEPAETIHFAVEELLAAGLAVRV